MSIVILVCLFGAIILYFLYEGKGISALCTIMVGLLVYSLLVGITTYKPVTNDDSTINIYDVCDYALTDNMYCVSYISDEGIVEICNTDSIIIDDTIVQPKIEIINPATIESRYDFFFPWVEEQWQKMNYDAILYLPNDTKSN